MLPKISTEFSGSMADYNIETMGDTTHVMVNGFCYHIAQIKTPELKAVCEVLLQASKAMSKANADKSLDDAWNDALEAMSTQTQAR